MGRFTSVFTALILRFVGYTIFTEPKTVGQGPLLSSYFFLFACFLLLYDMRLYPRSLRTLGPISQTIVEFFIADFIMENALNVWFALEVLAMNTLDTIAEYAEDTVQSSTWNCETFCDFLKSDNAKMAVSYDLSIFFLLAVLHAIRAVDVRHLKDGPRPFFRDIMEKLKKFFRKRLRALGIKPKRRVKINVDFDMCAD